MASMPVSVSSPYTLFPLAPPLSAHKSRAEEGENVGVRSCLTSLVQLPSAKKRKLVSSQVAAAVDGEGVNIYDIASTQIVSSFATPTSTKFSCAPSSIRTPSLSRTYAATSLPKRQILGWAEDRTKNAGIESEDDISTFSWANQSGAEVIYLTELCQEKKPDAGSILAVFSDSQVKCLSADLVTERWSVSPSKKNGSVLFATTTTTSFAKKSIFKNRPDVFLREAVSATDDLDAEDLVLLTISLVDSELTANFYTVPTSSRDQSINKARHLVSLSLPSSTVDNKKSKPAFAINFLSGNLFALFNGNLVTYSLNGINAAVQSSIPLRARKAVKTKSKQKLLHSLTCISPTSVMVSTPEGISVYETKYSSLQSRVLLHDEPGSKDLQLSLYIKGLDLVIGSSKEGIAAVQLSRPESGLKPKPPGLVLDSICRGVQNLAVTPHIHRQKGIDMSQDTPGSISNAGLISIAINQTLRNEKRTLKRLRSLRLEDVDEFEAVFAKFVDVRIAPQEKTNNIAAATTITADGDQKMANGITAGHEAAPTTSDDLNPVEPSPQQEREGKHTGGNTSVGEFITPKSRAWAQVKEAGMLTQAQIKKQERSFYWHDMTENFVVALLSMIFELKSDGSRLEITFFPTNVVKYLVESGNFSSTLLRMAESRQREDMIKEGLEQSDPTARVSREIGKGGFVDCLIAYDPSLDCLAWFLRELQDMEISEIIAAVKTVLSRFNNPQQPLLLTADLSEEDEEQRLQRLTLEAEAAIEHASSALDQSQALGEILRLSVGRLKSFPAEVVVDGLRSGLAGDELMGLIRILRKELIMDRYGDRGNDEFIHDVGQLSTDAADIELICELLTSALDAVGVAGLILANDTVVGRRSGGVNVDLHGDLEFDTGIEDEEKDANKLLISSLHSEVTYAVKGVQEAAALSGLLSELFRHVGGIDAIKEAQRVEEERKLTARREKKKREHKQALEAMKLEMKQAAEAKRIQKAEAQALDTPTAAAAAAAAGEGTPPPPLAATKPEEGQQQQSSPTKQNSLARAKYPITTSTTSSIHQKHHKHRRLAHRDPSSATLSTPTSRLLFQQKLLNASVPAKTFTKQLSIRGKTNKFGKNGAHHHYKGKNGGGGAEKKKPVPVRAKKDAMLPLGLPPKTLQVGGVRYTQKGTVGELKKQTKAQLELGVRRSVGVYSLEKLVV